HRATLVTSINQLEEQVAAAGKDRQIADLINDEQREAEVEPDLLAQHALALGLGERTDEIGEGEEVHAAPGLHCLDAQGECEMTLSGTGRTDKMDHLTAIDEAQFRQGENAVAI